MPYVPVKVIELSQLHFIEMVWNGSGFNRCPSILRHPAGAFPLHPFTPVHAQGLWRHSTCTLFLADPMHAASLSI